MTTDIDELLVSLDEILRKEHDVEISACASVIRELRDERDALTEKLEQVVAALRLALPMMRKDDWGADYGDGTDRRDALYAAIAILRQYNEDAYHGENTDD